MANPYEGHTLKEASEQVRKLTGWTPEAAFRDMGYRGYDAGESTKMHLVGPRKKKLSRSLRKGFRRRAAIEPIIGHMKSGHRLNRNHYKGQSGDAVTATLSAAGFNLRKLLAFFLRLLLGRVFALRLAGFQTLGTKSTFATA